MTNDQGPRPNDQEIAHGSFYDPPDPHSAQARKAALVCALDSAVTVIVETRELIRDASMKWQPGDKQKVAVTLEELGRICWSVARECERPAAKMSNDQGPMTKGKGGAQ